MKKLKFDTIHYTIIFVVIIFLISCNNNEPKKQKIDTLPNINLEDVENLINNPQTEIKDGTKQIKKAEIEIENQIFDFGTIIEGEKVQHAFKIKNIGNEDLIILDTKSSCGCTVLDYPATPIKPGNEKIINAAFDSKGKMGPQSRKISIFTNSFPGETYIELKGNVVKKK